MTMREEIIQQIQHADQSILEQIKLVLEKAQHLPATKVKRTPEDVVGFEKRLDAFINADSSLEATQQLLEDMKHRPHRRTINWD